MGSDSRAEPVTDPSAAGVRSSVEVERKYDVGPDAVVPDLNGALGAVSVTCDEHLLEAVYFDTDDLRLRRAGITLRHRTGGTDAGWHLKLPAGRDREELTVDAGPGAVPDALQVLVRSRVRERELTPVASLSTRRIARRLLAADGTALAELADDTVVGRPLPNGRELRWREWEVELLAGDDDLLDAVQGRLLPAGAVPAASASKLGRVLPQPGSSRDVPWWAPDTPRRRRTSAGTAVQDHLAEQVTELITRDPQARRDLPDALHKMRVATRRLRSALVTFRPLLERERTDPVRDELRWLAGVLGAARDAEVLHARLRRLVAAEPDDPALGQARDRIDLLMRARHRTAHDEVLAVLDGRRYLRLLDALDELVAAPPFLPAAAEDAAEVLPHLVRRTWRRLDRTMTAAERVPEGPERERLLHEVRKDAKRSRYAAEAVRPVVGRDARRYAAAVEALQESLGDLQDGVVTKQVLRELGADGSAAGFVFGRLHALEQVRADAAVARWPKARAAVSRRRLRRWFAGARRLPKG